MTNEEVFNSKQKWAIEENLCFMLQTYWEEACKKENNGQTREMTINPVTFVKEFMEKESYVYDDMIKKSMADSNSCEVIDGEYTEVNNGEVSV